MARVKAEATGGNQHDRRSVAKDESSVAPGQTGCRWAPHIERIASPSFSLMEVHPQYTTSKGNTSNEASAPGGTQLFHSEQR
jgi:hypothetical protein